MAFGRRSNDAVNTTGAATGDTVGASGGTVDLPPHILRLIETMDRMFRQAADAASQLREGRSPAASAALSLDAPINVGGYEKLFEHVDGAGTVLFSTYYFTQDVKSLDPDAQYQLSLIHQKAVQFNMLVSQPGAHGRTEALAPLLDAILVKSAYFGHGFRSYAIVTDILTGRLENTALNAAVRNHQAGWVSAMDRARAHMFQPDTLMRHAPARGPLLLLSTSGPYREGQRVIDGVVFAPELAKVLMDKIVRLQAHGAAMRSGMAS